MSEYQYYEFQAVDRPLEQREQQELRAVSTRARITASSFTNHYEWGDLKADPADLLGRYFDLFLYVANWGSRRFALRLPGGVVKPSELERFALAKDTATIRRAGDHMIVDMYRDEEGLGDYQWDDGTGWMGSLSPLREAVLTGDLRMFYLLWLMAVEWGDVGDEVAEPLPGIAPLTASLRAFAEFFVIDDDLLEVAAQGDARAAAGPTQPEVAAVIGSLTEDEKTSLLLRLYDGDPHVGAELRRNCRKSAAAPVVATSNRTAGELRAAARRLTAERSRIAEAKAAAERRREEEERSRARAEHLAALAARGEAVWREVEDDIGLRNAQGYDRAAALLVDLNEIAADNDREEEFTVRLAAIFSRHERKGKFIERLRAVGLG